ncbi:MAG: prepilin peptidase [Candidatus Gracilibacteria bacterium]|nr:prepilin peptidase [Candidatus Gracilibacteria bacterium]
MELLFLVCLFLFGVLFGSFSSVVIYRLKSEEKGILGGRSHCANCNHILDALDLIPIFSWLVNKARCRYCKSKISSIYPLLELSTGTLFMLIGYFLIDPNLILSGNIAEIIKLLFWLSIGFITIIYTFYDILFLEIHEGIMLTGILLAIFGVIIQSLGIIDIISTLTFNLNANLSSIYISILILLLSLIGFYTIMLIGLHEIWDFLILVGIGALIYVFSVFFSNGEALNTFPAISATVGAFGIFTFFFLQIVISRGAWLGGGDLRIAILIGLLLGISLTVAGTFMTYIAGSLIGIVVIIISKIKNKGGKLNTQIPFGPFLAIGFFVTIFYQNEILNLLKLYF